MSDEAISDQLYRDVFLSSPFGIYTLDKDGVITSFNPKMAEMAGDEVEKAIGVNALEIDSYKKAGLDTYFREGIKGHAFETEVEYTSYIGNKTSTRHYRGVPIPDQGIEGQARLLLIVEDITERKKIEQALESLARFTNENTNPVMRANRTGEIVLTNKPAEDIIKYWSGGSESHNNLTLLTQAVIESLSSNNTKSIDTSYQDRTVLFELIPQTDANYVNIYGRDVTEERRTQEIKDHFLSVTSHELRTPITVIRGYTDLILRDPDNQLTDSNRGYIEKIQNNCLQLIDFVNNLLDLNKLESGQFDTTNISEVDLSVPIVNVVNNLMELYMEADIKLHYTPKTTIALVDQVQFERIITNLLSNSLKFTEAGGEATVTVVQNDDTTATVAVKDTGIGIEEEDLQMLFLKYSQINPSQLTTMHGTGLGLAICKELVDKMHGTISVESEPGQGSIFYVTLPTTNLKT